jgi:hypothetical protein
MGDFTAVRGTAALVRNLLVAAMLYATIFTIVEVVQTGRAVSAEYLIRKKLKSDDSIPEGVPVAPSLHGEPPANFRLETINPRANWFNRPLSTIEFRDDYLGPRPDVDLVANLTRLVEACRGSYERLDKMFDRKACFEYINNRADDYLYLPAESERASAQSPRTAEYLDADGEGNTREHYPSYKPASKSSLGRCNGPIIPYHVYWTGPASWRLEMFVKAYLYTQNLPCTRLWMWLDTDKNPNALEDFMTKDPLFARFLPFIERGDITLHPWKFPSRLPLPPNLDHTDGGLYYEKPGKPNAKGEVEVAEGLIRDATGQEWLVLTEKQKTFLPVAVSDAVRFVTLHVHGGLYLDMDVTLLRDMRPLLMAPDHAFAERWGQHPDPGEYNTAILSLTANSTLSSYLLRGGIRMGMNFHPRVLGRMMVKDARNHELPMLETSMFDPIWWEYDGYEPCTVPCLRAYDGVFKSKVYDDEWEAYEGPEARRILGTGTAADNGVLSSIGGRIVSRKRIDKPELGSVTEWNPTALAKHEYHVEEDNFPPTNRTLEHFFRGAYAYHVHNQVSSRS